MKNKEVLGRRTWPQRCLIAAASSKAVMRKVGKGRQTQ